MSYLHDCGYTAKAKVRETVIKKWVGSTPVNCELCKNTLDGSFVDGATVLGPWAKMCNHCHVEYGIGLGSGRGQRYDLKTLEKVEG